MNAVASFTRETFAIADAEVRKIARDPSELLSRAVQPVLWLAVFGQVFGRIRAMPTGPLRYLDFMAPGILAQSILFSAIFYGIAVIWERDLGIVHKILVTPAHRSALVTGKAVAAGLRGLVQAAVVYAVAALLGVGIRWSPGAIALVVLAVFVGSCVFSTFSLLIACVVKTRERFMGIGQLLTMPLFFASNAIYPLDMMPGWLRAIAHANPLTYLVDLLRGAMVVGAASVYPPAASVGVLLSVFVALLALASRAYPGLAR